ncbi:hypothetical protein [Rhizobium jaguaris]|uniref:hypothetical protein n=1 Tax=Rhizobium jaguaris TaxID=1312183 RepID=UPI0013C45622|nr:hypothetical protein [Rhizobium jaguaris]
MELVVSCDGVPASSEPELATQADKMREARKIADTADRRIGTRTQKQQSTTESMPSENHRHEMLTDNYQKRLNPIFTVQRPTSLREEKATSPLIVVGLARAGSGPAGAASFAGEKPQPGSGMKHAHEQVHRDHSAER